jgi:putative protease
MSLTGIELLAPAGSPEALDAAIGEGADAVYLGLKNFNARLRSANFAYSQFEAALRALRRRGKKLYVTVNTVFEQREADRMYQLLKYLAAAGPDALIVQDAGAAEMIRSCFPQLKIHASTQMNIASARGVNALSRCGVSRVVLARELSLAELCAIRAETNMELEVFVHGALCVSASGLCLFSSFLGGKSANRGMCTQACRRLYHVEGGAPPSLQPRDAGLTQPPLRGRCPRNAPASTGYYFSPGDLQLLERLPDLAAAGINALKIEGRMKSADYVGAVVAAYRLALDAIAEGGEETVRRGIERGREILRGDFARAKTQFYFNAFSGSAPAIDWLNAAQDGGTGIALGAITEVRAAGDSRRGRIADTGAGGIPAAGDSIRLHRADDTERVSHKLTFAEADAAGGVWLSIPAGFGAGDRIYLTQTRALSKRYEPLIRGGHAGGHSPGREKAPLPKIALPETPPAFPAGLYAAVSRVEDLYLVQSIRPAMVIVNLTRKTAAQFLAEGKPPLPFKPDELILSLDPYFPQSAADETADWIGRLAERGYRRFILNNLGHFSLFRDQRRDFTRELALIAGPWLYMFNAWALSFFAAQGVCGFVSPLENNRQNLERTLSVVKPERQERLLRALFFIPVFAYPPLFRIRADLGAVYDFGTFTGNGAVKSSDDEFFSLISDREGSQVIAQKPFSIVDKIPFLKEAGFRRFIIDLSGPPLKKNDYKEIIRAAENGTPLPRVSRFNWKNGFYKLEETGGNSSVKFPIIPS